MEMGYLIVLKFGTQKGGVRAHLGIKNMINSRKDICDYSRKITLCDSVIHDSSHETQV